MENKNPVENPLLPILDSIGVGVEKKNEILEMASTTLEKMSHWKELSAVTVVDHTDKKGIKQSNENRLKIRRERIEAEKFLEGKRAEVKEKKAEFDKEDMAYLKLQQYIQKEAKVLEEELRIKEETAIRYEEEQTKILVENRKKILEEVKENPDYYPLATLPEEAFQDIVDRAKLRIKQQEEENARIAKEQAEKAEALKKAQEVFTARKTEMTPYLHLQYEGKGTITLETSQEDYLKVLEAAKQAYAVEQQRLLQEQEYNKRKSALFALGFAFNGQDFVFANQLTILGQDVVADKINLEELEKQVTAIKDAIEKQKVIDRQKVLDEQKRQLLLNRKEALLPYKEFVTEEITLETSTADYERILLAAQKAKKESEPVDLKSWIASFKLPAAPEVFSDRDKAIVEDIHAKFVGFQNWSNATANSQN